MADYDLLVIGGGAGGLNVASAAAQLGATVALVEKRRLGGDCLWHGCVPSKALIRCAAAAHNLREIDHFGVRVYGLQTDFPQAMKYVHDVQARIAEHDDPERFRKMGVDVFFGDGHFVDDHTFELEGRRLVGRKIVIATGSRPLELPIPGLAEVGYLTNLTIFDLPALPRRLLVLGGGPIGVEMGQSFARLGSSVTIIETNNHLLPHDDPECTDLLASAMVGEGIQVLTGRKALRAEKSDHGAKRLVVADKYGQEAAFEGDEILLAVGRAPNSPSLGLAAAGVQTDKRGFITVDKRLRTSRKHIFALGDAKGFPMFTHMAEYEAGVVVPNALYGLPRKARYTVIPWCTCSDPEVARVGLTEQEAHEAGLDVAVYKVGFDAADRPVIDDKSAGLVKLVCRKKKLLGASVVGHRAGDILQQYVMAMANGLPVTGVSATIEVYPGYGELARRAANLYYKKAFFEGRLPRIMHRLRRLHGRVGPQR